MKGRDFMDAIEMLLTRRSIRKFKTDEVPKDLLEKKIECAKTSPTGMNKQERLFTVVTKEDDIQRLASAIAKSLDRDDYHIYYAKALIIVTVPEDLKLGDADTSTAMQNIYLASHALGLASVWINQLRGNKDEGVRKVLSSFKIPENHISYGMMAIGYADEVPKAKERTEKVVYL